MNKLDSLCDGCKSMGVRMCTNSRDCEEHSLFDGRDSAQSSKEVDESKSEKLCKTSLFQENVIEALNYKPKVTMESRQGEMESIIPNQKAVYSRINTNSPEFTKLLLEYISNNASFIENDDNFVSVECVECGNVGANYVKEDLRPQGTVVTFRCAKCECEFKKEY